MSRCRFNILGVETRVTMISIKLNRCTKKLQERTSRVSAQFRAGYPISSDRVSPRKRVFAERFHVRARNTVSLGRFVSFIMYEP